jgi:hypothetical protein
MAFRVILQTEAPAPQLHVCAIVVGFQGKVDALFKLWLGESSREEVLL